MKTVLKIAGALVISVALVFFAFPRPEDDASQSVLMLDVSGIETDHPYDDMGRKRWIIESPGAAAIELSFDESSCLAPGDRVEIRGTYTGFNEYKNASHTFQGEEIASYTLDQLAGATVKVRLKDRVIIMLYNAASDGGDWGFKVASAAAYYDE